MAKKTPRLAVRAVLVHEGRILLVNAWPAGRSRLLCAPGGGVEPGASLPENLTREVYEETGLNVEVGLPCLINEFHDPRSGFHQVEVFFHCHLRGSATVDPNWQDKEDIVSEHVWASPEDFAHLLVKPDSLRDLAFSARDGLSYDALEKILF